MALLFFPSVTYCLRFRNTHIHGLALDNWADYAATSAFTLSLLLLQAYRLNHVTL